MGSETEDSPRKVASDVDDAESRTKAEKRLAAKRRQEVWLTVVLLCRNLVELDGNV